jgi:hypothetical protein
MNGIGLRLGSCSLNMAVARSWTWSQCRGAASEVEVIVAPGASVWWCRKYGSMRLILNAAHLLSLSYSTLPRLPTVCFRARQKCVQRRRGDKRMTWIESQGWCVVV